MEKSKWRCCASFKFNEGGVGECVIDVDAVNLVDAHDTAVRKFKTLLTVKFSVVKVELLPEAS